MNVNKDLPTMLKVWALPLIGILAMLSVGFWSETASYFLFTHHLFWIIGITLLISPIAWTLRSSPTQKGGARSESPARRRTPEEVRAQREAFMAAKATRATGQAPASTSMPTPVPVLAAAPAVEKVAAPAIAKVAPKTKAAPPPSAPKAAAPAAEAIDSHITRRELLNYAWLASIALLSVETVDASLWFAFPSFKAGQFGGQFAIGAAVEVLPELNAAPIPYTDGKFWLVNLDTTARNGQSREGILALFKVCTHLGCLYEWVPVTDRFECPCHGSKFELTGDYISGPARRSLDRFVIQAIALDGSIKETDTEGNPLVITGDETLIIDTGKRILGAPVV